MERQTSPSDSTSRAGRNREQMPNFIMVTPARNEEDFLPRAIESVAESSLEPKLWVIVNDNSRDATSRIIEEARRRLGYVREIDLQDDSERDLVYRYAYVCVKGFEKCISLADEWGINWDYVALLDADTVVEPDYFRRVISAMENNVNTGIASGSVHILQDGSVRTIRAFKDTPSGTARLWRKRCFLETGGYAIAQAPDTVSTTKAKLKGWNTTRLSEPVAYQLRQTSSADGLWIGYITRGKATYYLDYNPILVLARCLEYVIQPRFYLVIPYLIGYFRSLVNHDSRIGDQEIRDYYRRMKIKELIRIT